MTDEAPEFHTKTLSPLSPLPVHPPEPSNIPVLRNQIDPVFNMTSTHIGPPHSPAAAPAEPQLPVAEVASARSSSADSSFSDAYKEQPVEERGDEDMAETADLDTDDYAKTFDSDGDEKEADKQATSQANIEQEAVSLPVAVAATDLPSSSSYEPSLAQVPNNDESTEAIPSPSLPTAIDAVSTNLSNGSAPIPDPEELHPVTQNAASNTQTYEAIANGEIDIQQLLDNITANAEKNEAASATFAHPSTPTSTSSFPRNNSSLPAHASLPPRPQLPQSHTYQDDIAKYHAGPPGVSQSTNSYRPVGAPPSLSTAGAPAADSRGGLPPPPSASFGAPPSANSVSPSTYNYTNRAFGHGEDEADDIDKRWGPEVQKKYDEFLELERRYVTEGMWDRFPKKSRLFIGNLPSEKVTKRDLFHIFHKYGRIAQVSIKQAYGFIQFHEDAACAEALAREQGSEVRDRKMHLEISRPQKNSRNAQTNAPPLRRSRSPDYSRGGMQDQGSRQGQGRMPNVDHYNGRSSNIRLDEYGRPLRMRDDYRPMRSPSPPRFRGGRDEYPRGRDSYGRDRRRSRSRSPPYGIRDDGRYRERSPSPRARETNEDMELQIPRRDPRDVPDVQIILMDQLDRGFVSWVEGEFRARSIKTEVMFLSPRLPLQAVIRRQILEGVHAVLQLTLRSQNSSKVPLQVFDRQGGADNVRFDEYQDLEPKIAAELVLRAKQTHSAAQPPPQQQMPQYGQSQYPPYQAPTPQQAPYQPPAQAPTPNITSLIGQLSGQLNGQLNQNNLQQILSSLGAAQQNAPAAAANSTVDLAGILNGLKSQPQQQQQQAYQPPPSSDPYAPNPALAPVVSQTQPQQQSAQQVQNIMAQLARFRQ